MSSSSTQKQQPQQQQQNRRINNSNTHQSRNTNAYSDREEYHRRSLINNNNYWNQDYHGSNEDFYINDYYQHRNIYPSSSQRIRKGRQLKAEQRYNSKPLFPSSVPYYENIPPRHRLQQQIDKREQQSSHFQETATNNNNNKLDEIKSPNSLINNEQAIKPAQSPSSSSSNSDISNNRKDLHAKNLATAAMAARQQTSQPQTNLGIVQALMNNLILQQQQQQQPSSQTQSQSTVQLQYQLTNALLATMIQQRLKEAALQAQAQQIQAALPTVLAAQALIYQQGQLTPTQQQAQSVVTPNVAHPGTKFNNHPLVKFPVIRPTISPNIRSTVTTNLSRHRLGANTQQTNSTTTLPTYQQVQEIERGISLDEAIHLKGAIDIANTNQVTSINNNITE